MAYTGNSVGNFSEDLHLFFTLKHSCFKKLKTWGIFNVSFYMYTLVHSLKH